MLIYNILILKKKKSLQHYLISIENNILNKNIVNFNINSIILDNNLLKEFITYINNYDNPDNLDGIQLFTKLIEFLKNKEVQEFKNTKLENHIFNEISKIPYFTTIVSFKDNILKFNYSSNNLFKQIMKKDIAVKFRNNIDSIIDRINNNKFNNDCNVYTTNLFNSNISNIFIINKNIDELKLIIDNVCNTYINIYCNTCVIITSLENEDEIKSYLLDNKTINFKYLIFPDTIDINFFLKLIHNQHYCKDIYILNSSNIDIKNNFLSINNNIFNSYVNNFSVKCFKFKNIYYQYYRLVDFLPKILLKHNDNNIKNNTIYDNIEEIQKILYQISIKYFSIENNIINMSYNIGDNSKYELKNIHVEYDEELLEKLYDQKEFEIIFHCIKYTLLNRISTSHSLIFKYIAISPYTNYFFTEEDFKLLLELLELKSKQEIIYIYHILNNVHQSIIHLLHNYMVRKMELNKENINTYVILKYIDTQNSQVIDISEDKPLLHLYIDNLTHIKNTLALEIKNINTKIDPDDIINSIENFINTRLNLLDLDYKKKYDQLENKIKIENIDNLDSKEIKEIIKNDIHASISNYLVLSDVMMSSNDILIQRKNAKIYIDNLFELLKDNTEFLANIKLNFHNIYNIISLFKYSYHGISNRNFFTKSRKCFTILFKYYLLDTVPTQINKLIKSNIIMDKEDNFYNYEFKNTNPKKILFMSQFLGQTHSVFKDRHQVITYLANNGFDVYICTQSELNFKFTEIYKGVKSNIVIKSGIKNFLNNIKIIREHNFDKVIFCEIGMSAVFNLMANFRLGRVQFNTWGHSDTSGLEFIDYYVSSKLYELPYEESQKHYSEKLILQDGLCTSYANPIENYDLKIPRTFYGLSKYDKIILCPQSLFKIYPDYDDYLFEILYRLPDVNLVFVDAVNKKYKMYERWDNKIPEKYQNVLSRVKFIPGINHEQFVNLINNCDIMLDPYPFGGCNTSFEGFACNIPIVTQASDMINGRFTSGFYHYMGFTDLIAKNKKDYINLVCNLINNKEFYQQCVSKIKENQHKLFKDQKTLHEWAELMNNT